jgi:hypothetical protein
MKPVKCALQANPAIAPWLQLTPPGGRGWVSRGELVSRWRSAT